ncbi:Ig-like domain-containing protein [Halobaculum sp. D14]|uniref:Ig-like domain-containing protein n=1 Tax=Halobaculum sp. D14 TaxID=3421642 RepID=UPI003EBF3EA3
MRLLDDDRAQSVQIGVVILFGFLVVAMSMYQATVVPQQNEEVEFRHSQAVQNDIVRLGNSIDATGRAGSAPPATVKLGTRYPTRTFFVNPPPASGSLRTEPGGSLSLSNVTVLSTTGGEANDYWTGGRNFSSKFVVYQPQYNEYREAPVTRYESTAVVNDFGEQSLVLDEPTVVDGDKITLVTVNGTLSRNGVQLVSVDPSAVSTIDRRETVSGNLTIVVPTTLSATTWSNKLLDDELAAGWVTEITQVGADRVRIHLNASRDYSLGVAAVGVGRDVAATNEPAYVDVVRAPGAADPGSVREVVVEVRDKYGNPVTNTQVNGLANGPGSFVSETVRTDNDGYATFEYRATDVGSVTLQFSYGDVTGSGFDASTAADANVSVTVTDGGSTAGDATYSLVWDTDRIKEPSGVTVAPDGTLVINASVVSSPIDVTVRATSEDGQPVDGASVDFSTTNASVAAFSGASSTGVTAADGRTTVQLSFATGEAVVYATAGGGGDSLPVRVVGGDGGEPLPSGAVAFNDANENGVYDDGETTYTDSDLQDFQNTNVDLVVERDVTANGFDIQAASITVESGATMTVQDYGATTLQAENGAVRVAGTIDTTDATGAQVTLNGDSVDVSGGTIRSAASISVTASAGEVSLDGATIDNTGGNGRSFDVTATGTVSAEDAEITVTGLLRLGANGGPLDASGAELDVSSGSNADLDLISNGDMTLTNAELVGDQYSSFDAELSTSSATLSVDGAVIRRGNGNAKVLVYSPDDITVSGSATVGTVSPN